MFVYCLSLLCAITAKLSHYNRDDTACKAKTSQKSFSDLVYIQENERNIKNTYS